MGEATAVLTDSDYFARHAEFSLWLKEAKGLFFEDLSAAKSRKKFSKFVDLWNRGSLPGTSRHLCAVCAVCAVCALTRSHVDKFYKGISTQDLEHNTRTGYQWGFTNRIDEKEALTLSSSTSSSASLLGCYSFICYYYYNYYFLFVLPLMRLGVQCVMRSPARRTGPRALDRRRAGPPRPP